LSIPTSFWKREDRLINSSIDIFFSSEATNFLNYATGIF